ncbi:hypothetical protein J6P68_05705 [bacterium]|nr:hypothetical protein [bacterium]
MKLVKKMTYKQVINSYNKGISISTVHCLIKMQNLTYQVNFNSNPKNYKYIYIYADDTFTNVRVKNKKFASKFRILHIYQDYKCIGKSNKKSFINEIKIVLVIPTHLDSKDCLK